MAINPNSLFPTKTEAPDADYPYGSARNVTAAGDGTGTPWREEILDDMWGFFQSLLSLGGVTPSGNPDTVQVSQYIEGLRNCHGFPGLMVPVALNFDPATVGLRILLCTGAFVAVSSYPDLVANTYVGDTKNPIANSLYRTTDGVTRSTTGQYFHLPDMRGRFLRGLDVAAIRDEQGIGRIVGSYQDGAVSAHSHSIPSGANPLLHASMSYTPGGSSRDLAGYNFSGTTSNATTIISGNNTTADNRPYNVAVNWGIWY